MKLTALIFVSFLLGAGLSFVITTHFHNNSISSADLEIDEDLEVKTERLRDVTVGNVVRLTDKSLALEGCEVKDEIKAIGERLQCNLKQTKAKAFWPTMDEAEQDTLTHLHSKNLTHLSNHISCDAYDLSWYEQHCEADRVAVEAGHIKLLLDYMDKLDPALLPGATWVRDKPDRRRLKNANWILRSRLINKNLNLQEPWKFEKPPLEDGTIILLEQKLDGKIYIGGVPVTGVE